MKTAAELYPDYAEEEKKDGSFYGPGDYTPILDNIGTVLLREDDDDYQGDSRVLYADGERIGFLQFGWGSCSGCDALHGCEHISEIQTLMDNLRDSVKWFANRAEALEWFKTHDWEGDYSWHDEEQKRFVEHALALLSGSSNPAVTVAPLAACKVDGVVGRPNDLSETK